MEKKKEEITGEGMIARDYLKGVTTPRMKYKVREETKNKIGKGRIQKTEWHKPVKNGKGRM